MLGALNQQEEVPPQFGGGPNSGSHSNNTGAINTMLKQLDHSPGGGF